MGMTTSRACQFVLLAPLCLALGCFRFHGTRGDDEEVPDAGQDVDAGIRVVDVDGGLLVEDLGCEDTPAPRSTPIAEGWSCAGTMMPPPPPGGSCLAGLCGNGRVDTCEECVPCGPPGAPPGEMCCTSYAEECDGSLEASCEASGYAGGSMSCSAACTADAHGCDVCPPGSDCFLLPTEGSLAGVDIARGHGSVGVVWSEGGVVRMLPELGPESVDPRGPVCLRPHGRLGDVSMVATETGWLIAFSAEEAVEVWSTTGDGAARRGRRIEGAWLPMFARDAALLTYVHEGDVWAEELDDEGDARWSTRVVRDSVEARYGSALATPTGYLVAQRGARGVEVVHLDADGCVTHRSKPGSDATEYPQLAWEGERGTVTWAEFGGDSGVMAAAIDAHGERLEEPYYLGRIPTHFNEVIGDGEWRLVTGYTGWTGHGDRLDLARLADRRLQVVATELYVDPNPTWNADLVVQGGFAWVAWMTEGSGSGGAPARRRIAVHRVPLE